VGCHAGGKVHRIGKGGKKGGTKLSLCFTAGFEAFGYAKCLPLQVEVTV
jgi:hypothetical protein